MKVIGLITPEYERSEGLGTIVKNGGYVNGSIIAFTPAETNILKALQEAIEGDIFRWFENYNPDFKVRPPEEGGIDKALWLVYQFTRAKFAVNEFRATVDRLDEVLTRLDEGLKGELDEL